MAEHYFLALSVKDTFGTLRAFEARLDGLIAANNLEVEHDRDYDALDQVRAIVAFGSDTGLCVLRMGLDGFW